MTSPSAPHAGDRRRTTDDRPPIRIVHVDAERGFSGGEVQVFLLIDALARRGHDNLLLCPPDSAAAAEAARRGVSTAAVPMRGDLDLVAVRRLRARIAAAAPDLVHLHTGRAAWLGGLAAWLAGVPALVTRRMDRPVRRGWRTRLIYERLTRRCAAISPAVVDCLVAGGVPPARITLIPSAVDVSRVRAARPRDVVRQAEGATVDDAVLLTMSALVARKGIDVLLAALALLADRGLRPRLWCAGDGPERAALSAHAEALGLASRVRFLGQRSDVGDLLAASDVVVLPSRREGLGVAALEAMAAGRPVVASAVGGLADAIADGRTGLLVPPARPAPLAAALERLLRDREMRATLGAAGAQRIADRFSSEHMATAYQRLYREVLAADL
jgi:glycosyltransferase involved in cell wall biosynthesis